MLRGTIVAAALAALMIAGCATVTVAPADLNKRERCGVPFYLQRPYVAIKREVPVEGDEGFLVATIDRDSDELILQNLPLKVKMCLSEFAPSPSGEIRVPFHSVKTLPNIPAVALDAVPYRELAANAAAGKGTSGTGKPGEEKEEAAGEKASDTQAMTAASGIAKFDPSVPQSIDAGSYLEVIFLPDLDEKYTVDTRAGLGTASMSVAHGPGNTLNQFQTEMDNRELGKFVFESLAKVRDLALKKVGLDSIAGPTVEEGDLPAEGGATSGTRKGPGAKPRPKTKESVLLKYIYLGYATPGLFPILKDKEYKYAQECTLSERDPFLVKAVWPYTRYSLRVRRELSLWAPGMKPGLHRNSDKPKPETIRRTAAQNALKKGTVLRAVVPGGSEDEVEFTVEGLVPSLASPGTYEKLIVSMPGTPPKNPELNRLNERLLEQAHALLEENDVKGVKIPYVEVVGK